MIATSNLHELLVQNLHELKLTQIAETYREVLDEAARKNSSMLEVLSHADRRGDHRPPAEGPAAADPASQTSQTAKRSPNTNSSSPNEFPNRKCCGYSTVSSSTSGNARS